MSIRATIATIALAAGLMISSPSTVHAAPAPAATPASVAYIDTGDDGAPASVAYIDTGDGI